MSFFMRAIGNPFVKAILRSPLHPILSESVVVLSVTGKKTGKVYSFPVNYQREGNEIWIVSQRDRTWWRNLRGGAKVMVYLSGKEIEVNGEVFEENQYVAQHLRAFVFRSPRYGDYLDIGLDREGNLDQADVVRAAESRVMVRIELP